MLPYPPSDRFYGSLYLVFLLLVILGVAVAIGYVAWWQILLAVLLAIGAWTGSAMMVSEHGRGVLGVWKYLILGK